MSPARSLAEVEQAITTCRRCPRLVAWREEVARVKRAAFADEEYWGRPLPGFGDPAGEGARARVWRRRPTVATGPGGSSPATAPGDWLFAALWRAGYANQPTSVSRDDGLELSDCFITAAVRCAPPANRPLPEERDQCQPWLSEELSLLAAVRVIVCLGGFAWDVALRVLSARGAPTPRPRPKFGHGAEVAFGDFVLLGCYHPSQQNTFTGG